MYLSKLLCTYVTNLRKTHTFKPNKTPTYAFKYSNRKTPFLAICSRKDLLNRFKLSICLPKNSSNLKTFLDFDYLHLCIYKEQRGG